MRPSGSGLMRPGSIRRVTAEVSRGGSRESSLNHKMLWCDSWLHRYMLGFRARRGAGRGFLARRCGRVGARRWTTCGWVDSGAAWRALGWRDRTAARTDVLVRTCARGGRRLDCGPGPAGPTPPPAGLVGLPVLVVSVARVAQVVTAEDARRRTVRRGPSRVGHAWRAHQQHTNSGRGRSWPASRSRCSQRAHGGGVKRPPR